MSIAVIRKTVFLNKMYLFRNEQPECGRISGAFFGERTGSMTREQQDQVLRTNTALFVKNTAQSFKDLVDVDFSLEPAGRTYTPIAQKYGFTVVAHFSGRIQGDFLFSTSEMVAARIASVYPPDNSLVGLIKGRVVFVDIMREALNLSSQMTLVELEHVFGPLTLQPSSWIFGEYHMADYVSGIGVLRGTCGRIQCSLILNMASIKGMENTVARRLS